MKHNYLKLIGSIVVCELAGIFGSIFTAPSIPTWYTEITKPSFNPPSWVFGPVWTLLFALMGISFYLVWMAYNNPAHIQKRRKIKGALVLFGVQLLLNVLWSIIFFGLHNIQGAFIEIIFLWITILATIIAFSKISRLAMWLLIPYIMWVSFAAFLNYSIMMLN